MKQTSEMTRWVKAQIGPYIQGGNELIANRCTGWRVENQTPDRGAGPKVWPAQTPPRSSKGDELETGRKSERKKTSVWIITDIWYSATSKRSITLKWPYTKNIWKTFLRLQACWDSLTLKQHVWWMISYPCGKRNRVLFEKTELLSVVAPLGKSVSKVM